MKTSQGILFAGLVCAAMALTPGAVFAQHGGGGSHGGGGGFGGGGHFGGGMAHSSAPASAPANHGNASASGAGNTANPNGGGHWWNSSHSPAANEAATSAHAASVSTATGVTTVRPAVGRIFSPTRPGYGYYYPYYPYYYNSFYGGCAFLVAAFGPYDSGCLGYGFGGGYGFGWGGGFGFGYGFGAGYYGSYYGGGYSGSGLFGSTDSGEQGWTDSSSNGIGDGSSNGDYTVNAQNPNGDANANPSTSGGMGEATPSVNTSGPTVVFKDGAAGGTAQPAAKPNSVLYLKDGSSFAVTDYWLAQGKLHYVTSYGGENSMDLGKLDLQKTVDENAKQGTAFSLKSAPGTAQ